MGEAGAFCVGVDVGSLSTKVVVLAGRQRVGSAVVPTGFDADASANEAIEAALAGASARFVDVERVVATGVGKKQVQCAQEAATELICAGKGAYELYPDARVVIEMGAESTLVIRLGARGNIADFSMNDKCASGTGIFLNEMAKLMGVPLEEMGARSLESQADVDITSTCVVFAESEVVSQVHRQVPKEDILKGLHKSIAKRIVGMVNRLNMEGQFLAIGGLARNIGVVRCLEELLDRKITVAEDPELVSALGAGLQAQDGCGSR